MVTTNKAVWKRTAASLVKVEMEQERAKSEGAWTRKEGRTRVRPESIVISIVL